MTSRTQSIPTSLLGHLISPAHFPSNAAFLLSFSVVFKSGTRGCCSQGSSPQHRPYTTQRRDADHSAHLPLSQPLRSQPQAKTLAGFTSTTRVSLWNWILKHNTKAYREKQTNNHPSNSRQSSLLEATKHKQSSLGTRGLPPAWQKHGACAVLWRPRHTAQCLQPPSCHRPGVLLGALTEGTGFRTQRWHLSLGLETLPGGKAPPLPWGQPCLQPS